MLWADLKNPYDDWSWVPYTGLLVWPITGLLLLSESVRQHRSSIRIVLQAIIVTALAMAGMSAQENPDLASGMLFGALGPTFAVWLIHRQDERMRAAESEAAEQLGLDRHAELLAAIESLRSSAEGSAEEGNRTSRKPPN
jgi:hypothetical protein